MYDITNEDTFEIALSCVERLQELSRPNIFVALLGNKADLVGARMVKYEVIHVCCKVHVGQILRCLIYHAILLLAIKKIERRFDGSMSSLSSLIRIQS